MGAAELLDVTAIEKLARHRQETLIMRVPDEELDSLRIQVVQLDREPVFRARDPARRAVAMRKGRQVD